MHTHTICVTIEVGAERGQLMMREVVQRCRPAERRHSQDTDYTQPFTSTGDISRTDAPLHRQRLTRLFEA